MDINEGTTTEDLWTPYKELVAVVEGYLSKDGAHSLYSVHSFESILRRHKQTFLSLLKYPTKNPTSRDEIKRGITEGVTLPSVGRTMLSKELVDEAIIISDMYNVNEYLALELLHTACRQQSRHPGLARGLLAIILYYDGRRAIVHALKHTLTACDGVQWSINAREDIIAYVTRYVDQLISDGLLENTLDALKKTEMSSELELLQNNRALPPAAYHAKLLTTMEDIRTLLAGVIFVASAQKGLKRDFLLRLLSELTKSSYQFGTPNVGVIDDISLALQMALLYALDLSVLHRRDDGEELAKKLPLIQDPELLTVLIDELSRPQESNPEAVNKHAAGIRALCQLSLGLSLAALKRAPHSLFRSSGSELKAEIIDQDEMLVDAAIDGKVFEYLDEVILSNDMISREEFYQRRLHSLITDFIVLMHSKLMEMRARANETARSVEMYVSEGLVPPTSARGPLHALLRCVEKLYSKDPLGLRNDYWLADTPQHSHRSGGRAASLYKFVRVSGELVSGAVLGGYLRALASLSVPKHTWGLLVVAPPPLAAHHLLTALARYYCNLRQDPSPLSDQFHSSSLGATAIVSGGSRPNRLLVRQEEVEAMISALKLIEAVAKVDQNACAAICENLQWDAVNVMFGLVCCHVPIQLKAELVLCLSALGSTPSTAGRVWSAMEAAGLLQQHDKRALSADLHEVECRLEEYPLSRAFLMLIESLSKAAPLPSTLGAGVRPPGLDPYVHHILHRLAIPAPHRAYANPAEKYKVLSLCLRVFVCWVEKYTPSPGEFPSPGTASEQCVPAGLHILLQLHSGGELLRLLLLLLCDTVNLLHTRPLPDKEVIEDCLKNVLRLLELGLQMERSLIREAAEANRSVLVIGLSKLILAPESGMGGTSGEELLVSWCRALQLRGLVSCGAMAALAVLLQCPNAARRLLATASLVRHYFVECLEAEEWPEEQAASIRQSKESLVLMLQQILPSPAPNLAQYLLGYSLSENVSSSALNEPGVEGTPRTCLHSILEILDQFIAGPENPDREATNLVEGCYRLLYWLCARPATSAPALRFLRARDNFLCRHLKATIHLERASVVSISSRSWVVRACGCEAGAGAAREHHSALHSLLHTLIKPTTHPTQEWEWCLIRRLLEGAAVCVQSVPEPRWEMFSETQLHSAIQNCDINTGMGGKRISVARIHALLSRELNTMTPSVPHRNRVAAEIQKVLDYVTDVNRQRNQAATLTHYFDSWRQLTEIIFCVAPQDVLTPENKKTLILNILQDLLNKIPPTEVLPQIGNLASGTVLLLLVNLRHSYILQKRDSNMHTSDFETTFFGSSNLMQTKSLTLKFVLQKILSWILISSGSTQKIRVNLYGALLNFLNIVNLKSSPAELDHDESNYVSRLDRSVGRVNKEDSCLKNMVIEVISGYGEGLCNVVCADVTGSSHHVCRMIALASLDTLLELHPHSDWMNTLTNHGYLASLIDSILQDNEDLKLVLEPNPKSLRVLYVYESKMCLLLKIASTPQGASRLVTEGLLTCLSSLTVLTQHPDVTTHSSNTPAMPALPTPSDRYREILLPALALCNALITSLGQQNHSALLQIMHFMLSHIDSVDLILRACVPTSPIGLLQELEAVTSVLCRSCDNEMTQVSSVAVSLRRLHTHMLSLLQRFRDGTAHTHNNGEPKLYYKIVCNVMTYARNMIQSNSRALFRPTLNADVTADSAPPCGALVQILQTMVAACHSESKMLATLQHQLHNLHSMTVEELKKLVPNESFPTQWSGAECRSQVSSKVRSRALSVSKDVSACVYAVELATWLVATHLKLFLLNAGGGANDTMVFSPSGKQSAVSELRRGITTVFNDRFTEQLLDTAKNLPPAQRGILDILVKEIKTTLQFAQV